MGYLINSNLDKVFGVYLKNLIKAKGYTQKAVGVALGVAPSTVSQWCNGVRFPTLSYLASLCIFLDCDFNVLFSGVTAFCALQRFINKSKLN